MDGDRFDSITRRLGRGASRRDVLRKIAGGALGGTLAVTGLRRSGAAPADKVGVCHHTGSASNPLVYIEVSQNAVPAHAAHGDATYVDLNTDVNNCGACGTVCGGDACNTPVCQGGTCGTTPVADCCLTDAECDDGVSCTVDACVDNACVNTPDDTTCADTNECTDTFCDPILGCQSVNNTGPCTAADGEAGTCAGGFCQPNCQVTCVAPFVLDPVACECICPVATIVCPPGEVVEPARCVCIPEEDFCEEAFACAGGQAVCGDGVEFCGCFRTTENDTFCIRHGACGAACTSSDTCTDGRQCVFTCCGGETQAFCQLPCSGPPPGSASFAAERNAGSGAAEEIDGPTTYPR